MNETPSGHEGGSDPPEQRPIPYVCAECRRAFSVPAGAPSQMVVDPQTGRVVKVKSLTGGDHLRAAEGQANAMSRATLPLRAAVERALKASEGARAVSAVPQLRRGHPLAEVTVAKGQTFMTVSERLE